jgi:hypothetical protein
MPDDTAPQESGVKASPLQPIFQGDLVPTADGGVEPIEMDAVHWTMRGQAMYAYFSAKDITGKDRHCDFRFMAQFARTPYAPDREVAQNLSEESICRDGDSYYSLDGEPPVLEIAQLQVSVHFLKNAKGRIAGAVSDILSDTTQKNAIAASESVFNSIALDWTARANLPLFIDAVQVDSVDDKQKFTKIVIPFPDALNFDVLPKLPANVPGMLPFVALFSEGIRAASPFYRFLCFFKIVGVSWQSSRASSTLLFPLLAQRFQQTWKMAHRATPARSSPSYATRFATNIVM